MKRRSTRQTRRLPTMNDVAKLAGVSQTTVSFVVNDTPNTGISDETKRRILDAIHRLGYRRNAFAKSLRSKRSHIIGLVTDNILTSPYAGKIIQGAEDAASSAGKILLLVNSEGDPELEKSNLETVLEHQVDGMIYATMSHKMITPPHACYEVPCVLLDCCAKDRRLPSVVPDEVNSALNAVSILLERGHRRIGFINSTEEGPSVEGRLTGYRQALSRYGVSFCEDLVRRGGSHAGSGYENTIRLMQSASPPTALFCFNDQMALGVYDALRELQLDIPQDVAVMGFDNLEIIAAYLHPGISTMELPHHDMGMWAVTYLLEHIEHDERPKPVQHRISCRYIERASV